MKIVQIKSKKSMVTIVGIAIIALKANVFQIQGMESPRVLQTEQNTSIDTFDDLLAQAPVKSRDEMFNELNDAFLANYMAGIKINLNLSTQRETFGTDVQEQIFLKTKDTINDIYFDAYKDHSLDQLKILHTRSCSPLLRSFDQTFIQLYTQSWDYLRYGIAHYNSPCDQIPHSKLLALIGRHSETMSSLLLNLAPAFAHHSSNIARAYRQRGITLSWGEWDGIIPNEIWNQMQLKYRYTTFKMFNDAQIKNIVHHSINKIYRDLLRWHPQAVAIINDFMNKHESLYLSSDQVKAFHNKQVQPIIIKIVQNKEKAVLGNSIVNL